jgi:predicted PurR-regulated permease PerM
MIPNITLNSTTRWGVNILLLLAGVVALHLAQSVIIPLLIALMLAAVLGPVAAWLHSTLKIRWSLACLTVICGLLLFFVLLTLIFGIATSRLAVGIPSPTDTDGVRRLYRKVVGRIHEVSPFRVDEPAEVDNEDNIKLKVEDRPLANEDRVIEYLRGVGPGMMRELATYTSNWAWQGIVIIFILLFVLLEGRMLARRVVAIFGPSSEVQSKAGEVLTAMAKQVRIYVVNRTLLNFGLAIVMGAIYYSFGLNQWLTWAVLLAILNYIPYLGPIVAGLPPFVDAFVTGGPGAALGITIIYAIAVTIEAYFFFPWFLGRSMDLNATTVMLGCLFWDLVWGTTGLFLVMPILAGIKEMLHHVPDGQPWADLMSTADEPPKPPALPLDADNGDTNGQMAGADKHLTPGTP